MKDLQQRKIDKLLKIYHLSVQIMKTAAELNEIANGPYTKMLFNASKTLDNAINKYKRGRITIESLMEIDANISSLVNSAPVIQKPMRDIDSRKLYSELFKN